MDYNVKLQYHYKPKKGWVNDPNGLVYFKGYYHIFYQHLPDYERPSGGPMHWGHARTKDFLHFEELSPALFPDMPYDENGCWSGTAIVKDDTLYLFYASIKNEECERGHVESVSIAYSRDGVNFEKYEKNPVICGYPSDGCPDFRDPAVAYIDGEYYIVMASGHKETKTARLLLYKSANLFDWQYIGIMKEWVNCKYAECPSFMQAEGGCVLSASVCEDNFHYFSVMIGDFKNNKFTTHLSGNVDKGPDQYAGQIFKDDKGRLLMITWIPGWKYSEYTDHDVGCMSVPREIVEKDGKIYGRPIKEIEHLFTDSDSAVKMTADGFTVDYNAKEPFAHKGNVTDIKILRDGYILEIFVNGGETVYSFLL